MAIKELKKPVKPMSLDIEKKAQEFISKGGSLSTNIMAISDESDIDHRLTLRIPKWLMDQVDEKRKKRLGNISRNLFILEAIEKATKK